MPCFVKSAVAATARNLNRVLHAFGTESAMADFFGHPYSHPLADSYFSQAPMRFGDYVAKLGAVPATQAQRDGLTAADLAEMGITVIGLTGRSGGKLKALCDRCICIPSDSTARIQEAHITVIQIWCGILEDELFPDAPESETPDVSDCALEGYGQLTLPGAA